MALAAASIFEINSAATASNVNGGGFNPENANMMSDLTTDPNTANTSAPVCSSATYNFAAGDVGHWLFIKSGTSWTPGWYQIASVADNKATLSAAVGAAVQDIYRKMTLNTVAGCATVGTPTGGVFTIDYSQGTAAILNITDAASLDTTAVLTSATGGFTKAMIGNVLHITAGSNATVGWYEIVNHTTGNTITIDRDCTAGATNMTGATVYTGGALSLGSSDDAVFELGTSSTTFATRMFIKGSTTYTINGGISISKAGAQQYPVEYEGYATKRGDRPTGSTRPIFDCGAAAFTNSATKTRWRNIIFTGTGSTVFQMNGTNSVALACKVINTSTVSARNALAVGSTNGSVFDCELISIRGVGFTQSSNGITMAGCYIHDCGTAGLVLGTNGNLGAYVIDNIVAHCRQDAITHATSSQTNSLIMGNTLYGRASAPFGDGLDIATAGECIEFFGNLITGFAVGVRHADTQHSHLTDKNNYYNNTLDISAAGKWSKGPSDIALDPELSTVERYGATATTTAGDHLVQSGATFQTWGIAAGDYVMISGGTGPTAGIYTVLTVDSETQLTTVETLTANATADKVWSILKTRDFSVGANMKAVGYPAAYPGTSTTSYTDIGAAQRVEPAAESGRSRGSRGVFSF